MMNTSRALQMDICQKAAQREAVDGEAWKFVRNFAHTIPKINIMYGLLQTDIGQKAAQREAVNGEAWKFCYRIRNFAHTIPKINIMFYNRFTKSPKKSMSIGDNKQNFPKKIDKYNVTKLVQEPMTWHWASHFDSAGAFVGLRALPRRGICRKTW